VPQSASEVPNGANPWKRLLGALDLLDSESVIEDDDTITITSTDPNFAEKFAQVLRTPEQIKSRLQYTIQKLAADATTPQPAQTIVEPQYLPIPSLAAGQGKEILHRIFGRDFVVRLGFNDEVMAKWTDLDDQRLSMAVDPQIVGLRDFQIKALVQRLQQASHEELWQSCADPGDTYLIPYSEANESSQGPLGKYANKIIYKKTDPDGKKYYVFDYGLLHTLVYPPKIANIAQQPQQNQSDEVKQPRVEVKLQKSALMAYLHSVFPEGFVLDTRDVPPGQAVPICLAAEGRPMPRTISILLDCSKSMKQDFGSYIQKVESLITDLALRCEEGDVIRVVPFDSVMGDVIELRVKKSAIPETSDTETVTAGLHKDFIDSVKKSLATLQAKARTLLYGTIENELKTLASKLQTQNITVIIFTDGCDNESTQEQKTALEKLTEGYRKGGNVPKIITFGLGQHYDVKIMEYLATLTGSEHIKVDTIKDMQVATRHLDNAVTARELIRFIQTLEQTSEQVVVARVNQPVAAAKPITLDKPFEVDGSRYHATSGAPVVRKAPDNRIGWDPAMFGSHPVFVSTSTQAREKAAATIKGYLKDPKTAPIGLQDAFMVSRALSVAAGVKLGDEDEVLVSDSEKNIHSMRQLGVSTE